MECLKSSVRNFGGFSCEMWDRYLSQDRSSSRTRTTTRTKKT